MMKLISCCNFGSLESDSQDQWRFDSWRETPAHHDWKSWLVLWCPVPSVVNESKDEVTRGSDSWRENPCCCWWRWLRCLMMSSLEIHSDDAPATLEFLQSSSPVSSSSIPPPRQPFVLMTWKSVEEGTETRKTTLEFLSFSLMTRKGIH